MILLSNLSILDFNNYDNNDNEGGGGRVMVAVVVISKVTTLRRLYDFAGRKDMGVRESDKLSNHVRYGLQS